jgi:hypothetical protein
MQVPPGLKKRSPFAFASDDDDKSLADAGILDDQGKSCTNLHVRVLHSICHCPSEQEEIIQKLKVENDISDKQIWLSLRIIMGCFALLSVPVGFCSCNPLKVASSDMFYISFGE